MNIKDRLEMFIEVFDGNRADLVQNLADCDPIIMMRIGIVLPGERSHQGATLAVA